MKRWKKALLIILLLLVLAVAAVLYWQRENISAAYTALTTDKDKIAGTLEEVRESYQQVIRDQTEVEVKLPSLEQNEGLLDGVLSPDEVKDALGITETLKKPDRTEEEETRPPESPSPEVSPSEAPVPSETATPSPSQSPSPAPTESQKLPTAQELIDRCVAELTACQVDLMAQLGEMKQKAVEEWRALPAAKRTPTKKKEIGLAGLAKCYELEGVIDDKVREILGRYRKELTAIGADLTILDTLWDYYEEEKAAQKAYYLKKYMD